MCHAFYSTGTCICTFETTEGFFYVYTSYKLKHNKKVKHLNLYFYMYEASSLFTRTRINIPGMFNKLYM